MRNLQFFVLKLQKFNQKRAENSVTIFVKNNQDSNGDQ